MAWSDWRVSLALTVLIILCVVMSHLWNPLYAMGGFVIGIWIAWGIGHYGSTH